MRSRRIVATTLALAGCLALAACSGSGDSPAPRTTAPTPIGKLDVSSLRIARAAFCDQVPKSAVRRALGADVADTSTWKAGDPAPTGGSGDVAHELGCAWTGRGSTVVRAWVFARPVSADFARQVQRQAGRAATCTVTPTATFGSPSYLRECTALHGVAQVRRAGLFGDTWLTCELVAPADRPRERLDSWCAAVVAALDVG
jgi:hypothetical protein